MIFVDRLSVSGIMNEQRFHDAAKGRFL